MRLTARHLVLATGPLHVPQSRKFRDSSLQGKVFHSARWDHGYDLDDKRVASIGTGGSAIQYCPEIAPRGPRLHVFQRTPAWVIPRDRRGYSEQQKRRYEVSVVAHAASLAALLDQTSRASSVCCTPRWPACLGRSPRRCLAPGQGSGRRGGTDARIHVRLQPVLISNDVVPDVQPAQRRTSDERHSRSALGLDRHRRRRRAACRLHHPRHGLRGGSTHLHEALRDHGPARPHAHPGLAGRRGGVLRRPRHRLSEPAPAGRAEHRARPQLGHLHDRMRRFITCSTASAPCAAAAQPA